MKWCYFVVGRIAITASITEIESHGYRSKLVATAQGNRIASVDPDCGRIHCHGLTGNQRCHEVSSPEQDLPLR